MIIHLILPLLIPLLVVAVQGKIDGSAAEGLMQIQRVLELSSEIAKAEDVSITDGSTAESKITEKRESYALPDNLVLLVNNHINDIAATKGNNYKQQSGQAYVTPVPDQIRYSDTDSSDLGQQLNVVQYQHESQLQYALPAQQYGAHEQQSQSYAVPKEQELLQQQHQNNQQQQNYQQQQQNLQQQQFYQQQQHHYQQPQYAWSQEIQQYQQVLKSPEHQYSNAPVPQSYAAAYIAHPSIGGQLNTQELTAQHGYPVSSTGQLNSAPQGYEANGQQHYDIAAQQAAISHQMHPKQMLFVGGHSQTGSYTEAVIHPTPGQYAANIGPTSSEQNGPQKVQINIHPQPFGLLNGYRNHGQSQQQHYVPLQILINNMAEPTKYPPGISPQGGPEQPRMPVYHYSPVPAGTIKDEHVPEMRIKSTYTPPNPHSDKYKDFPSSAPQSKPVPPPTSTMTFVSAIPVSQPVHQPVSHLSQPVIPTSNAQPLTTAQTTDYDDDEFIKYDFGYRVSDSEHKVEFGKTESKKDGVTKGSYHVLLPDGRLQVVKYWSDHTGYHTDISYTVPGAEALTGLAGPEGGNQLFVVDFC